MSQTPLTAAHCGLSLAAVPIGNLGDISSRTLSALAEADLILAEDTRRTGLMLAKLAVSPKKMLSFFEHNEAARQAEILELLHAGKNIVLVSDAGTPLFADPGFRLVRACREQKIPVRALPGPSAVLTALSVSGIAPVPFTFLGFAPRKQSDCARMLRPFASIMSTLVIFERKDRLEATLKTAFDILGAREVCVTRELTKTHEEIIWGRLGEWTARELLGEITLVIGPPEQLPKTPEEMVLTLLREKLAMGLKVRTAAKQVKELTSGWDSKDLYALARDLL